MIQNRIYEFWEKVTKENPYCDEMYNADYTIAERVFRKHFGSQDNLSSHKYDLLQLCVVNLCWYRKKYFDPEKGKYEAGASDICKQTIVRGISGKQWKFENNLVSMDETAYEDSEENEAVSFLEVMDKDHSIELEAQAYNEEQSENFYEVHNEIIGQFNTKAQEILQLFMDSFKEQEIAEKIGCRRQYVSRVKTQYKCAFVDKSLEIEKEVRKIS